MLSTEDNYKAVGSYVCDSNGNCGRALGAIQLMSYRSDVRKIISSKSGGSQFLTKLDTGKEVTGEEMMQYFSPTEQQSLIAIETNNLLSIASQQVDPSTGKPFSGDRLIEVLLKCILLVWVFLLMSWLVMLVKKIQLQNMAVTLLINIQKLWNQWAA